MGSVQPWVQTGRFSEEEVGAPNVSRRPPTNTCASHSDDLRSGSLNDRLENLPGTALLHGRRPARTEKSSPTLDRAAAASADRRHSSSGPRRCTSRAPLAAERSETAVGNGPADSVLAPWAWTQRRDSAQIARRDDISFSRPNPAALREHWGGNNVECTVCHHHRPGAALAGAGDLALPPPLVSPGEAPMRMKDDDKRTEYAALIRRLEVALKMLERSSPTPSDPRGLL